MTTTHCHHTFMDRGRTCDKCPASLDAVIQELHADLTELSLLRSKLNGDCLPEEEPVLDRATALTHMMGVRNVPRVVADLAARIRDDSELLMCFMEQLIGSRLELNSDIAENLAALAAAENAEGA